MNTDVDAFLEHYGIKGMKWGVRRDRSQLRAARRDERWEAKRNRANVSIGRVNSKKVHEIAKAANKSMRSDIKALNKSPQYNTREAKKLIKEDKGYYKGRNPVSVAYKTDVSDIYMKHVKAVAPKLMQVSPSGKFQESLVIGSDYWNVIVKQVDSAKHSTISDPDISMRVRPIEDDDGYIIGVELIDDTLEQSSFDVDAFLEHYGIKGMKWGVRRDQSQLGAARKERESKERSHSSTSVKSMSDADLKAAVSRMNLEQQYTNLMDKQSSVNKGKKFVNSSLETIAKNTVIGLGTMYATQQVRKILKNIKKS